MWRGFLEIILVDVPISKIKLAHGADSSTHRRARRCTAAVCSRDCRGLPAVRRPDALLLVCGVEDDDDVDEESAESSESESEKERNLQTAIQIM